MYAESPDEGFDFFREWCVDTPSGERLKVHEFVLGAWAWIYIHNPILLIIMSIFIYK